MAWCTRARSRSYGGRAAPRPISCALRQASPRRAGALAVGVTTGLADEAAFRAEPADTRAEIVLSTLEGFGEQTWFVDGI